MGFSPSSSAGNTPSSPVVGPTKEGRRGKQREQIHELGTEEIDNKVEKIEDGDLEMRDDGNVV